MNVLIIGSGGREHALAWKISQSSLLTGLFIAPGNAGTLTLGRNIPCVSHRFSRNKKISDGIFHDLVVVGPEVPLVEGIHDFFLADEGLRNVPVIGPVREAAQLEGSKDFAKDFMKRHGIPTAAYATFHPRGIGPGSLPGKTESALCAESRWTGRRKGVVICDILKMQGENLRGMMQDDKIRNRWQKGGH